MEGLIFGGDHIEREICVTKSIGLAYSWKEICFVVLFLLCFISHLRAISNCKPRTGDLMEGFFVLRVLGVYIWRGLYMEGLIFGILWYLHLVFDNASKNESIYIANYFCFVLKLINV